MKSSAPISRPRWRAGLAAVLALAAGLRLWGLLGGEPVWHADEIFMVAFPLNFFSGDLNPHRFYYPTFHFYVLGLVYGVACLWQKLWGAGFSSAEFAAYHYFWGAESLRDLARLTSVAFALGTVACTALVGRRMCGPGAGLVAALLMAVCTVHVRQSPLAGVDAALTLWCAGAIWASLRLLEHARRRDYALAGALVGAAAATKYPGVAVGAAVAAAHLLARRSPRAGKLWMSGLVAAATFFALSPYVVLDFSAFLGHFLFQVVHVQGGRGETGGWTYQALFTLRHALGWAGLLAGAAGAARVLRRRQPAGLVVLVAFLSLYLVVSWGQLGFARYALPLLPLQAVLASAALQGLARRWQTALVALLLIEPLYGSVRVAHLLAAPDTRLQARAWIEKELPSGTLCCNFGGWAGDVPVRTLGDHWWRHKNFAQAFGVESLDALLPFLEKTRPPVPFYRYAVNTGNRQVETGDMGAVEKARCAYVLVHRHPLGYSRIDSAFARQLQERGRLAARWVPEGLAGGRPIYDPADAYYVPLAGFGGLRQPGPEIEVWHIEEYGTSAEGLEEVRLLFAHTWVWWAGVARKEGDADAARLYLRKALESGGEVASVLNEAGIVHRDLRDGERALGCWLRAVELEPEYGDALYNIALVYQVDLGDAPRAIPYWQRAIQAGVQGPDAYIHLANAHALAGRPDEARRWFRAVLERFPDLEQGPQIRAYLEGGP